MKKIMILFALLAFSLSLSSQSFNKNKLDSLIYLIESNDRCMGSFSLFQNDDEVYQKSFGFADVEKSIEASRETKYRIGSISKTYTATLIMQLVEEEKLAMDTKLSTFFPDMPNAEKISIEQLLQHRTGLFNFTNKEDYTSWMVEKQSRTDLLDRFIENGFVFEPGEKMEYSNTNYVLLSFIIEEIENKSYSEVLENRILKPCNLKNTMYGGKINSNNNDAFSYHFDSGWQLASETDMSIPTGAGALISTPTDINHFLNCLFTGRLVSANSLERMKTMVEGYGYALTIVPFYDKKAFGHGGGIDNFSSFAAFFPEEKVAFSITTNGLNMPLNDLMIGILSIYFGLNYELPDFTTAPTIEIDIENLTEFEGLYSNPNLPLKLKIFIEDNVLKGQGTGQPSFPLEAFDINKFRFSQAGLEIEFFPEQNKLILQQGGGTFELKKEEN